MPLLFLLLLLSFIPLTVNGVRCHCTWQNMILRDIDDYRSIASPDYPRNYCGGLDCSWSIISMNQSRIFFSSSSFNLRKGDELLFYSSKSRHPQNENAEVIHRCTWADTWCEFESPSSYLSIRFITKNGNPDHLGFHSTITVNGKSSVMSTLLSYSLHLLIIGLLIAFLISLCIFFLCCCQCSSPSKNGNTVVESRLL